MARFIKLIATAAIACSVIFGTVAAPAGAQVSLGISVAIGPPAIPYYVQPPPPGINWIWQPGYWAWDPVDGWYWVPGTWVQGPAVGLYWTPGYWAFTAGMYNWVPGYWGPSVGFYGGINYGYGYYGNGYYGGRWNGSRFYYNSAVTNVTNVTVVNRYVYRDPGQYHAWRGGVVAYNGGPHGVQARATAAQQHAYAQRRFGMTSVQTQHANLAKQDPVYRYNTNHGHIASNVAAARRPFTSTRSLPAYHASTVTHAAPAQHAAPVHHAAPAQHAAPVHHAAPAQHAAPVHHAAPVQRTAPVHHAAPVQHTAPVHHAAQVRHAAPVHHAAPAYHPQPQVHAYNRPAPVHAAHAAPAHAAPAHAAPAHAAPHPRPSERPN